MTQLMIGRDIGYLDASFVDEKLQIAERISGMLAGLIYRIKSRSP
jgi:hypothetical protein